MIPKETQERIKADAEDYALPMAWVNQNPKGEEQLFYEYISSTSYIAGATAENERVQKLVEALEQIAKSGKNIRSTYKTSNIPFYVKIAEDAIQQWNAGKGKDEPKEECTCSLTRIVTHGKCYKCPELTNPPK